jgi:hypothetical protein
MFSRGLLVVVCAACTTVTNEPAGDPTTGLSETVFKCKAEPVLVTQCSYLACHGNANSALRVYSVGKLRETTPTDSTALTAPLTDSEQHANYLSAAGFSAYNLLPADNWLVRKPLPSVDGGYEHKGGAIFSGPADPQYAAITQWLTGATGCN